jgi:protein-S-isoprenylcysteine O-methyltransferase Ste14
MKPKSVVLLGVQLACLAYLLMTGPWLAELPWIWIEIAGLYLGAWAVWTIKLKNLRPLPEPSRQAKLVTRGPYRWIRHPMYTAVLLMTGALVLDAPGRERVGAWLLLVADLLVKLHFEESLLAARFPEYSAYRKRTKRLIPFAY